MWDMTSSGELTLRPIGQWGKWTVEIMNQDIRSYDHGSISSVNENGEEGCVCDHHGKHYNAATARL